MDQDPHRLRLVLKSDAPLEAVLPSGGAPVSVLVQLGLTTAPCLSTLKAMGLPPGAAQQLHDDVLAYGLGLLVLQGAGSPETQVTLETRFVQTLHRWLDRERSVAATDGREVRDATDPARQGDLFAG